MMSFQKTEAKTDISQTKHKGHILNSFLEETVPAHYKRIWIFDYHSGQDGEYDSHFLCSNIKTIYNQHKHEWNSN